MSIKILAVTACPVGVAHTYMAAEAIKKAASKYDCEIKVETNGAVGVENELTEEDIKNADAIIVAADKNINIERFNGKPVLEVSVGVGLRKADQLIEKCLNNQVPIRSGKALQAPTKKTKTLKTWQTIYKHLMNGVSYMLPLVVAGGVLIAISYLWGIYSANPDSEEYNEIAFLFKTVGTFAMSLMVPVLTGFIAQSISGKLGLLTGFLAGIIAQSTKSGFLGGILGGFLSGYLVLLLLKLFKKIPKELESLKSIFLVPLLSIGIVGSVMWFIGEPCQGLNQFLQDFLTQLQSQNEIILGLVVGCMCSFDLGGPVNKAAYITGTVMLGAGDFYFMAGVSAACMTPPFVVALSATFFKNRFNKSNRTAAYINYILGATHITEGAIPFAAKNPLKTIPVFMLASSISAILTYLLKISVPAPHGGFLILPLVNHPLLWITCILTGSVIGMFLYVLVTPKVPKEQQS